VTLLGPSVMPKDQTHTTVHNKSTEKSPIWMNRTRKSSIFKDSRKCKATGPYFEPHGSDTCPKNDFNIILQAKAVSPMSNFFPSRSIQTVPNIMFVSPLINLFATCLIILRMLNTVLLPVCAVLLWQVSTDLFEPRIRLTSGQCSYFEVEHWVENPST
jgi:hypothetical protein